VRSTSKRPAPRVTAARSSAGSIPSPAAETGIRINGYRSSDSTKMIPPGPKMLTGGSSSPKKFLNVSVEQTVSLTEEQGAAQSGDEARCCEGQHRDATEHRPSGKIVANQQP
jgi:hypothetical protein